MDPANALPSGSLCETKPISAACRSRSSVGIVGTEAAVQSLETSWLTVTKSSIPDARASANSALPMKASWTRSSKAPFELTIPAQIEHAALKCERRLRADAIGRRLRDPA